jgi:hypothetical protein
VLLLARAQKRRNLICKLEVLAAGDPQRQDDFGVLRCEAAVALFSLARAAVGSMATLKGGNKGGRRMGAGVSNEVGKSSGGRKDVRKEGRKARKE